MTAVLGAARALDQAGALHAVDQARHVGDPVQETLADVLAGGTLFRAADEDAQDVVLSQRQVVSPEQLGELRGQLLVQAHDVEKGVARQEILRPCRHGRIVRHNDSCCNRYYPDSPNMV